jgi:hypothetical protein
MPIKYSDITFDEWLSTQNLDAKDLAHHVGLYEPEDFEIEFGNEIDKEDFINEEGELDEYDYLDAWMAFYKENRESAFLNWQRKYKRLPDPLILYRAIRLRDISKLDKNNLGVYWTDKEDSAYSYAETNPVGKVYTLKAKVPKALVDWEFTIMNNINLHVGETEQEINILEDSDIEVLDIKDPDAWLGISFKGNVGKIGGKSLANLAPTYKIKKATASILDFPRKTLSEDLWRYSTMENKHENLPKLKPDLRLVILNNIDKYLNVLKLNLLHTNLYGGAASYQWSPGSDIDVSVYADGWPENISKEAIEKYQAFFKNVEIPYNGFTIHLFLKPPLEEDIEVADAVYDILEDEWILPPLILPHDFDPDEYFKPFINAAEDKAKRLDKDIGILKRSWKLLEKSSEALPMAEEPEIVKDRIEKEKITIKALIEKLANSYLAIRKKRYALHDKLREKLKEDNTLDRFERFQEPEIIWKYLDRAGYTEFLHKLYTIEKDNQVDTVLDKY